MVFQLIGSLLILKTVRQVIDCFVAATAADDRRKGGWSCGVIVVRPIVPRCSICHSLTRWICLPCGLCRGVLPQRPYHGVYRLAPGVAGMSFERHNHIKDSCPIPAFTGLCPPVGGLALGCHSDYKVGAVLHGCSGPGFLARCVRAVDAPLLQMHFHRGPF